MTLEGNGYRVFEAATGQEGLVEAAQRRPDAIVLDLGLPDMDGAEVLQTTAGMEPGARPRAFRSRRGGGQSRARWTTAPMTT